MVVRPKWPGEDDTGGSSPDPSEAYSSADEASHAGWAGACSVTFLQLLFALCQSLLLPFLAAMSMRSNFCTHNYQWEPQHLAHTAAFPFPLQV